MPTVVPPAPEAASLGKYTDMPVNYSSGLPQISIPMFTASGRDISVPVSLSYHAGGIRVEEIASRVGLGWNLQAGGSVTRSVRGVADDKANGWLNTTVSVQDFKNAPYDIGGNIDRETMLRDAIDLNNDFEPDVFNFSYPGGGGKFYLKQNGDVMLVPNTEHKIEYTLGSGGNDIQSFTITDPSGYKYFFGQYGISPNIETAREESAVTTSFADINDNTPVGIPPTKSATHFTSWHLLAIESPVSSAKVTFDYTLQETKSLNRASQNQKLVSSGSCSVPSFITTYIYSENDEMVLNEIDFGNGKIDFVYETGDREDLQGGKALDKVILKDEAGNQVRAFDLVHDYFVSAGTPASPNTNIFSDHLKKRLYLGQVLETGTPGSTAKVYDLEYETSIELNLPDRFSTAQDVWGFYNGKGSNPHLIPSHFNNDAIVHSTTNNAAYSITSGADRRVDFDYAKANTLKKITYPTGGSASFEYESNGAYLADNQTRIPNTYFQTEKSDKAYFNFDDSVTPVMPKTATINFSVDENDLSGTLFFHGEVIGCPSGLTVCGMSVVLEGVGHSYTRDLSVGSDIYFNVAPGDYKLVVTVTEDEDDSPTSATALLSSFINPNAYKDRSEYNVGGLRILRTTLDDAIDRKIVREYSYVTDINTASGFLENNQWTFNEEDVTVCSSGPSSSRMQSSQSSAVSMGTGGGHIGYTAVREAQLPGNVAHTGASGTEYPNGYTSYEFDYTLSEPNQSYAAGTDPAYELIFGSAHTRPSSSEFPYAPFRHKTWQRGNMLSSSTYKSTGRFSELINKQENQYSNSDCLGDVMYDAIPAMRADQRGEVGVWAFYEVVTGNHHIINSRTTQVQSNGTIIENSAHSYTNHFLRPDKSTVSHSDGQKTISKIKYTDDSFGSELTSNEKTVLTNMVADNILAPVLTETFIDSEATPDSKSLTVYQGVSGLYQPKSLKIWNRETSAFEERLTYSYDGSGNYKVVSKDGAQHMAYIWDYNNLLPIAQVANVDSQSSIAYTSFEADGKGNWSFNGTPSTGSKLPSGDKYYTLLNNDITKTSLSDTKTYVLSFWAKDGQVTVEKDTTDCTGQSPCSATVSTTTAPTGDDWHYYRLEVSEALSITISGTGTSKLDELRLYPFDAQMTTYTYDPHRGVTTMGSANNLFTYYHYDDFGRLYKVLDHDRNIVKMVDYVYKQSINN